MRTWLLAAVAGMLLASTAAAQPSSPPDAERDRRARQHFLSGSAYFETGDYPAALRAFRASYEQSPHAEIQYNIYLCEERLGNLAAAIEALAAYLAEGDPGERRSALEQRLQRLRERHAHGDRTDAGDLADAHPIDPETGQPRTVDSESGSPALAIAGFSVAAAGLLTFAIAGVLTLGEDGDLRDACAPTCSDDDLGSIRTTRLIADLGAGVALAGAVVGLIGLLTRGGHDDPAEDHARLRLRGLSLEGSF